MKVCKHCGLKVMSAKLKAEHLRLAKAFTTKKPYTMPSKEERELLVFVKEYRNKGYCSQQFVLAGIAFMEHIPLAINKKEDGLPPTSKEVGIRPTIL